MKLFAFFYLPLTLIGCSVAEKTEKKPVSETQATLEAGIERITDGAKLFSLSQEDSLMHTIQEIDKTFGAQVGIYTLDTLMGRAIEDVSIEKAQQLKLGRKEFDDGILFTIALKDRKIRIELGEGLANIISDNRASQIIRDDVTLQFKSGNYFDGVASALRELRKDLENEVGRKHNEALKKQVD